MPRSVDLEKIEIGDASFEKIWLSETNSTLGQKHEIPDTPFEYLIEVIGRNPGQDPIGK